MVLRHLLALADHVRPPRPAAAHCDLMCGVYDPAQARIEADSVKACMEKYHGSDDEIFRQRAIFIKEERAELVKHHLSVLWTDYFKPPARRAVPQPARSVLARHQGRRPGQEDRGPRRRRRTAGSHRGDRRDLLEDQAGLSRTPLRPLATSRGRGAAATGGPPRREHRLLRHRPRLGRRRRGHRPRGARGAGGRHRRSRGRGRGGRGGGVAPGPPRGRSRVRASAAPSAAPARGDARQRARSRVPTGRQHLTVWGAVAGRTVDGRPLELRHLVLPLDLKPGDAELVVRAGGSSTAPP